GISTENRSVQRAAMCAEVPRLRQYYLFLLRVARRSDSAIRVQYGCGRMAQVPSLQPRQRRRLLTHLSCDSLSAAAGQQSPGAERAAVAGMAAIAPARAVVLGRSLAAECPSRDE